MHESELEGRKHGDMPCAKWPDGVIKDCKAKSWKLSNAKDMCKDRQQWSDLKNDTNDGPMTDCVEPSSGGDSDLEITKPPRHVYNLLQGVPACFERAPVLCLFMFCQATLSDEEKDFFMRKENIQNAFKNQSFVTSL